jgi:acyl-CoA thioester hydrolase
MPVPRPRRADFAWHLPMQTRWRDNDVYGHMNNVVYYEYFDTAVNKWLIDSGALDVPHGPVVALVVETGCTFMASLGFPDQVTTALRAAKLGTSSVTYDIAIFRNKEDEACATGRFTHVCVDRASNRPIPIPERMRAALATLDMDAAG